MRTGGVTIGALLLVLASTVLQVSIAGDIYWEGEEDNLNEFLEVKEDDTSVLAHLHRLKRDLFANFFGSDDESATESDDGHGNDDDVDNFGSGSVDKGDPDSREKTLRVTFTVNEPFFKAYSDRDSPEFRNFSRNLATAVDKLYERLPGTHRTSLVRIQSHINEELACKVTLDIVTSGYENIDNIETLLRNHIKTTRRLGNSTVNDSDFSSQLIDPGTTFCEEHEFQCDEYRCLPMYSVCNGQQDCNDGTDEVNCRLIPDPAALGSGQQTEAYPEFSNTSPGTAYTIFNPSNPDQESYTESPNPSYEEQSPEDPDIDGSNVDDSNNSDRDPDNDAENTTYPNIYEQSTENSESSDPNTSNDNGNDKDNEGQKPEETHNSTSQDDLVEDKEPQRGDGGRGETYDTTWRATEETPVTSVTQEPPQSPPDSSQVEITTSSSDDYSYECPQDYIRCDQTRCIERNQQCDGRQDCYDGSDEVNCPGGEPIAGLIWASAGCGDLLLLLLNAVIVYRTLSQLYC